MQRAFCDLCDSPASDGPVAVNLPDPVRGNADLSIDAVLNISIRNSSPIGQGGVPDLCEKHKLAVVDALRAALAPKSIQPKHVKE